MCCMNDGSAIANGFASSLADAGDDAQTLDHCQASRVGQGVEDVWQTGIDRRTMRHIPNGTVGIMLRSIPNFVAAWP